MEQLVIFVIIIVFLWLGILTFYIYKIALHYRRLVQTVKKEDLSEILDKILESLGGNQKNIENLKTELEQVTQDSVYHIQKVGILRFNPFADTGGDQSFILAILDGTDTGIVLTSLHSRGITRWYAKNVKEGKGVNHELSEEEQEAIKKAVHLKHKRK